MRVKPLRVAGQETVSWVVRRSAASVAAGDTQQGSGHPGVQSLDAGDWWVLHIDQADAGTRHEVSLAALGRLATMMVRGCCQSSPNLRYSSFFTPLVERGGRTEDSP